MSIKRYTVSDQKLARTVGHAELESLRKQECATVFIVGKSLKLGLRAMCKVFIIVQVFSVFCYQCCFAKLKIKRKLLVVGQD